MVIENQTIRGSDHFWPFQYRASPLFRSPLYLIFDNFDRLCFVVFVDLIRRILFINNQHGTTQMRYPAECRTSPVRKTFYSIFYPICCCLFYCITLSVSLSLHTYTHTHPLSLFHSHFSLSLSFSLFLSLSLMFMLHFTPFLLLTNSLGFFQNFLCHPSNTGSSHDERESLTRLTV